MKPIEEAKPIKAAGLNTIVSYAIIGAVVLLCIFAVVLMLVLPPNSLNATAVYQKF